MPWDQRDLTFEDERGPSALQRFRELCYSYGLSVLSNVGSNQVVIKTALAPFAPAGDDEASLADIIEAYAGDKVSS